MCPAEVEGPDQFINWLITLDDVEGQGAEERRSITLSQIIERARRAKATEPSQIAELKHELDEACQRIEELLAAFSKRSPSEAEWITEGTRDAAWKVARDDVDDFNRIAGRAPSNFPRSRHE